MSHPFEKTSRIWPAQELIDFAFGKATSQTASLPTVLSNLEKVRRKEKKRIENTVNVLVEKIKRIVEEVPNLEELPQFYKQLSHLLVNNDELRVALARINGTIPVIIKLQKDYSRRINKETSAKNVGDTRVEFFGRCASVIKKQAETLLFLEEARLKLMQVPSINLNMPCVVVAGYPNVGKSSIVASISSAKPQISDYPFTTKQIFIGMYQDKLGSRFFQVIYTPGVLDRPMSDRNEIEKQAILALNTIATVVLFVFDPTHASGYEISHQLALFHEIKQDLIGNLEIPIKIIKIGRAHV